MKVQNTLVDESFQRKGERSIFLSCSLHHRSCLSTFFWHIGPWLAETFLFRCYSLLGYLSHELLGMNFHDFVHEDDRNKLMDVWIRGETKKKLGKEMQRIESDFSLSWSSNSNEWKLSFSWQRQCLYYISNHLRTFYSSVDRWIRDYRG